MPTYQFMLHTTGVLVTDETGENPVIGFYSSRRARGKNPGEARDAVMAAMDRTPKILGLIQSGYDAGLQPQTVVEEIRQIPWWRALLPWREPGLAFYGAGEAQETGAES